MAAKSEVAPAKKSFPTEDYDWTKHQWAFGVDATKCIGCLRCVEACKRENNVPLDAHHFNTWVERYVYLEGDDKPRIDSHHDPVNIAASGSEREYRFANRYKDAKVEKAFFVPKLCNQCTHPACANNARPCVNSEPLGPLGNPASGAWGGTFGFTNGGVRVTLGPNSVDMSGGFRATFTVPGTSPVGVRIEVRLRLRVGVVVRLRLVQAPGEHERALQSFRTVVEHRPEDVAGWEGVRAASEALAEELPLKQRFFEEVDRHRRPDSIVATVSSGLSIASMADGRSEGFRRSFLGIHLFNPPNVIVGCEVIPHAETDPALYRETVRRALAEDLGWGDVTTEATVASDQRGRGIIVSKSACVIAGLDVAAETFRQLDPAVVFTMKCCDGSLCESGATVAEVPVCIVGAAVFGETKYASKDYQAHDAADVKELFPVPVVERRIYHLAVLLERRVSERDVEYRKGYRHRAKCSNPRVLQHKAQQEPHAYQDCEPQCQNSDLVLSEPIFLF